MNRTDQIRIEAAYQAEGNIDYETGFFEGALWASENPQICSKKFTNRDDFLKDNPVTDPIKRKYFLMYCDDKVRIVSMDSQGNCYTEIDYIEAHEKTISIDQMKISRYIQISPIR